MPNGYHDDERCVKGRMTKARSIRGEYTAQRSAAPPAEDPNEHLLRDLIDQQSGVPLSPKRAAEIQKRWGWKLHNVEDPEAAAKVAFAFEAILIVASFVPPLSPVATTMLVLFALARGDASSPGGMAVTFLSFTPAGRISKLGKWAAARVHPTLRGMKLIPKSMAEYQALARKLLDSARKVENLKSRLRTVTNPKKLTAAKRALDYLKKNPGDYSGAGSVYHKAVGAAGPGKGVDFLRGMWMTEIKTHFVPMLDDFLVKKGNETILAYVLKAAMEKGVVYSGKVEHVFINTNPNGKKKVVELVIDVSQYLL